MNGTLISHPPAGGGSGSSVTNGGPACAALASTNQHALIAIRILSLAPICCIAAEAGARQIRGKD